MFWAYKSSSIVYVKLLRLTFVPDTESEHAGVEDATGGDADGE